MPEPAMLDYFYGDEAEQYTFYRIPKVLFTDPAYTYLEIARMEGSNKSTVMRSAKTALKKIQEKLAA